MQKRKSKLIVLAMTAVLTVLSVLPVSAEDNPTWTIGYETNTNGPTEGVQGDNGWYFMYSEEVDTDGSLDTSQVKECTWATSGSCWFFYDYKNLWIPDIYAADGYDIQGTSTWWRMDSNGLMDPNTTDGALRSVIAWEAPQSGTYSINLSYTAGSQSFDWEGVTYYNGSGLTLSINTDDDVLDQVFAEAATEESPEVPTGTLAAEVTLKKGERIYFSADPGSDGKSDVAQIQAEIVQTEAGGFDMSDISMTVWVIIGVVVVVIAILLGVLLGRKKSK